MQLQNVHDSFIQSLFLCVWFWSIMMCLNFTFNKYKLYTFGGCRVCRAFDVTLVGCIILALLEIISPLSCVFTPVLTAAFYINTNN